MRKNKGLVRAPSRDASADVAGLAAGPFYVASRASVPERGQMWRALRDDGAPINSTWIDEDGPGETADFGELWPRIQREVTSAARLILYVEPDDFPLKGAFIEVGMALAAGVPVSVVAPGVVLDGRNCRPLGSWVRHPLVSFEADVRAAMAKPSTSEPPSMGRLGNPNSAKVTP